MKFWKSVLSLAVANGTTLVITFVFLLILVRTYNQFDYAIYKQGFLLIATLAPFLTWGLPVSLSYYIPRADEIREQNQYIVNCFAAITVVGVLAWIIFIVFREQVALAYNNSALAPFMGYFGGILLFENIFSFYPFYALAVGKARRLAIITIVFAVLRIVTLLLCVFLGASMEVVILVLFLNSMLKSLYVAGEIGYRIWKSGARLDRSTFLRQLSFSIPLGLSSIIYNIMATLDKNLTSMLYTPTQFTIYVNGAYDLPFIGIITGSISSALLPALAATYIQNDQPALNKSIRLWHQTILVASSIMIPLIFVMMVFSNEFITIIFTEQYIQSAPIFRVAVLGLFTKVTYFGNLLTVSEKQRQLVFSTAISVISMGVAYILIYWTIGFDYIIWADVIGNFVSASTMLWLIRNVFRQSLRQVYPWSQTVIMILVGLTLIFPFQLLKGTLGLSPILSLGLLGGLMFVICFVLNLFLVPDSRSLVRNATHRLGGFSRHARVTTPRA